jgi:selenide,water dikinase
MKNHEKRARVMRRSMQLGHCICNPKKPCPCDVLREKDICPCAGERLDEAPATVRLTQLVENAGCASKIDAATLKLVLQGLPFLDDPRVLVGAPAGDDAGVFRLDDETALVQTVDVFSPSVDDPYLFGQIAAANSLSDVYAMGGRPLTALSIVGFPTSTLPHRIMHDILRGGLDKMAEAGVAVLGGHSIKDPEIKAGFAVTGLVHPQRIFTNAGAKPGDWLVLTKPLGTGILAFAAQIGRAPAGSMEVAARWMAQLNRRAAELAVRFDAHAVTDVTGFGLAGHLASMAAASGVDVEITWDDLPLLPGVLECLAEEIIPGGVERNRESSGQSLIGQDGVPSQALELCLDPQTSGGLLIAVAESAADALVAQLRGEGCDEATIIGRVLGPGAGRVLVRHVGRRLVPRGSAAARGPTASEITQDPMLQEERAMSCCADPSHVDPASAPSGSVPGIQQKFMEFMKAAAAPGALDARTKRAIGIALSVLAKCEPCAKIHIQKARDSGFSQEEIDEAAWLAISFGGSPTMMFYQGVRGI